MRRPAAVNQRVYHRYTAATNKKSMKKKKVTKWPTAFPQAGGDTFFGPNNSLKPEDIQFTVTSTEKSSKLLIEKLETDRFGYFYLINDLITKTVTE